MPTTTMFIAAALQFWLHFLMASFLVPMCLLINCGCCCGKKKKRKDDALSMKLKLPSDELKKKEAPDGYTSKTTNKVSGLGPDDPDLDSRRLKLINALPKADVPEEQQQQPAEPAKEGQAKNEEASGAAVVVTPAAENKADIKTAPEVSPASTATTPTAKPTPARKRTAKTAKAKSAVRPSLLKLKEQKRQQRQPVVRQQKPKSRGHPDHCIAAATRHIEGQQSMPQLRPPLNYESHRQLHSSDKSSSPGRSSV